jgi:hypothetical protein
MMEQNAENDDNFYLFRLSLICKLNPKSAPEHHHVIVWTKIGGLSF